MPVERTAGGTMITGAADIEFARILTLRSALSLELKGMRLSHGRSALKILRQAGFKSKTRKAMMAEVSAYIEERMPSKGD